MGNADIVRSFYGAIEGGDLAGGLALLAPDSAVAAFEQFADTARIAAAKAV